MAYSNGRCSHGTAAKHCPDQSGERSKRGFDEFWLGLASVCKSTVAVCTLSFTGGCTKLRHSDDTSVGDSPSAQACCKEGAGLAPGHNAMQDALGHHAHWGVMHLRKGHRHLHRHIG